MGMNRNGFEEAWLQWPIKCIMFIVALEDTKESKYVVTVSDIVIEISNRIIRQLYSIFQYMY